MPELSEEHRMIQESAREFTREVVRPTADRLDPVKGEIPRELIEQMAELGYFGILIPEEYGGLGLGALEYCLVAEELARGWMSVASMIARGNALIGSLNVMPEEQKSRYLPRMARGEFVRALKILNTAPENSPRIHDALALAGQQWFFFEDALAQGNHPHALQTIATTSERMLEQLDLVVRLYEGLSPAS